MDEAGPPPPSAGKSLMSRLASDPVGPAPGAKLRELAARVVWKRGWSARRVDINRKIVVCDKTKCTTASLAMDVVEDRKAYLESVTERLLLHRMGKKFGQADQKTVREDCSWTVLKVGAEEGIQGCFSEVVDLILSHKMQLESLVEP